VSENIKRATGSKAAVAASRVLRDPKASRYARTAAASALTQLKSGKSASSKAAAAAAKVLRDPKASKDAKAAAASALTQHPLVSVNKAIAKRIRVAASRLPQGK
jgi:hypothetical protein